VTTDDTRERYEVLYRSTYPAVVAYVLRRVPDRGDAADVVAETYLTLWRRFDSIPAGADALPWIYGVARRTLANHRRGGIRRTALSTRLAEALQVLPEAQPAGPDGVAVSRALNRLTRADQELLMLVDVEGLTRDEVSVVLGASRPVVRVRLHRARQRLIHELSAEGIHPQSKQVPRNVPAAPHALATPEVNP